MFSITFLKITFEVDTAAEKRSKHICNDFLFCISFRCPPLPPCPHRCSGVTAQKLEVNLSDYDVLLQAGTDAF